MTNLKINPVADLEASKYVDSIYYADLFKIKGKIWMITGSGKSRAGIIACNRDVENQIADDAVALIQDNKILYGRHDRGAVPKDSIKRERDHRFYKIDYIAHCLTEEQSRDFYENKAPAIVEIDGKSLSLLLSERLYPAWQVRHFFSEEQCEWLANPKRRFDRFLELTNNIIDTKFLVVPWMKNIEEKAFLYTSF